MRKGLFPLRFLLFGALIIFHSQTVFAGRAEPFELFETPESIQPKIRLSGELKPGEVREETLQGGGKNVFTMRAARGTCVRLVVEQQGIDVIVTIKSESGRVIKKIDRPSGSYGRETVTFVASETGVLNVEISPNLPYAVAAKYKISYTAATAPTDADRLRDQAENLTSEGEILRFEDSAENKRRALERFSAALSIWTQTGDLYEQAVTLYGIAYTYNGLSDFYEAALYFNRSFNIFSRLRDEYGKAINYSAFGMVQYATDETGLAIYNYKKALETYKKLGNARGLAIVYHGLGTAQMLAEKHSEAILSLTESLRWRVAANHNSGKALTHITLGKLYLFLREFEKAETQFSEAAKLLGKNADKNAELLYHWGKFYALGGKPETAANYLEKAVGAYRAVGSRLGEALALLELSGAETALDATGAALTNVRKALLIIEELRRSALDFRLRVKFTATVQPFYRQYISLLMRLHEREPARGFDRQALDINEQARARGLLDQMERRALIRLKSISPELLERERFLHDKLTALLALQSVAADSRTTDEFQATSAQYAETEAQLNSRFKSTEMAAPPTLKSDEIVNYLDDETVLLEYLLGANDSFLWLVSKDGILSFKLPPEAEIESKARLVYQCFSSRSAARDEAACGRASQTLSAILLGPVAARIEGKRLAIVKHGYLNYLPFAALPHPKAAKYLIETNELTTLSSASFLKFSRNIKAATAPAKTLAVFADPVYSPLDGRLKGKAKKPSPAGVELARLFASRFEAERIAALIPPKESLVKTDFEASREGFFKAGLGDFRILHFAAHALVDDRQPELSSIALSFFDQRGGQVSGFLRPNDILRLDLRGELVVLSACRSGLGKQVKGEGMVSLGQSFFSAGARRLIVTAWDVDDKITAQFMERFYAKLLVEKKDVSVALRETQIQFLTANRWKQPFFWAAFSLEGDW